MGFRQVKGLRQEDIQVLLEKKGEEYSSISQLSDSGVSQATIEQLTDADAFRSMNLDRRAALWEVPALNDKPIGLFEGQPSESTKEPQIQLPYMTPGEHVVQDYASIGLSLKAHPVGFIREKLSMLHVLPTKKVNTDVQEGRLIKVAGLVLVRQRPGTAGGVCFITIEDETGFTNLVVFETLFDKYRKEILQARLLMVEGRSSVRAWSFTLLSPAASTCLNYYRSWYNINKRICLY
ncbi:OB-fold nucleic acid binding domain-containing protein [Mucilaginibacter sp. NFX135]|uniref:OB-fold nucleic acid binding domain-containing protein n=1 Tax=Mucilaginibacter sp. NFX135 TaxID=3402687 RepID=UPI003AFAEAEA